MKSVAFGRTISMRLHRCFNNVYTVFLGGSRVWGAWSSAAVMRPGDDFLDRGVAAGLYTEGHAQRLTLQCSAAVQGIAALMTSRRITLAHSDALIDDAIALHLAGASTAKWRSFADDHPWQLWPTGGRT